MTCIIASTRPEYDALARQLARATGHHFVVIRSPRELTVKRLKRLAPRYVFFTHWSTWIPESIYSRWECVIFHMTDVPYGRGGSPLQNLIVRGHKKTKLTAMRCVAALDAGPVYLKMPLSLEGKATDIFARAAGLIQRMILKIVKGTIQPRPQIGRPTLFKRRTPEQSDLVSLRRLADIYDYVRMLDAEGYPPAFLKAPHFRVIFKNAILKKGRLFADAQITLS